MAQGMCSSQRAVVIMSSTSIPPNGLLTVVHTHACMYTCAQTQMHIYTHVQSHTCIHMYILPLYRPKHYVNQCNPQDPRSRVLSDDGQVCVVYQSFGTFIKYLLPWEDAKRRPRMGTWKSLVYLDDEHDVTGSVKSWHPAHPVWHWGFLSTG